MTGPAFPPGYDFRERGPGPPTQGGMNRLLLSGAVSLVLAACGGNEPQPETPANPPPANAANATNSLGTPPATFAEQVALGQKLYGEHCSSCHGGGGNDGKAPKVVGLKEGALPLDPPATSKFRKSQFKTVADVADFVVKAMPPKNPGSLTAEQYWAILAFDLKANGIDLGDKKLEPALASTLTIPR